MRTAISTARPLSTGSTPGMPKQTGSISVLGGAPNAADAHEKILDSVWSCTWHSRPMTGSYWISAKGGPPLVPLGRAFGGAGDGKESLLGKRRTEELEPNRQPVLGEAARQRQPGQSSEVAGDREDIGEV